MIELSYETKHSTRVCCLRLERVDEEGRITGKCFSIKYHDIKGVVDFLVLWQIYDTALQRKWKSDSWFRCMVGDLWYFGHIKSIQAFDEEFPDSHFKRFSIKWDDNEKIEEVSPWELEPVNKQSTWYFFKSWLLISFLHANTLNVIATPILLMFDRKAYLIFYKFLMTSCNYLCGPENWGASCIQVHLVFGHNIR